MVVVKRDMVVHGMLSDELERCERLVASLEAAIAELPKGSLHQREMHHKCKSHVYHYLKFRDGTKSVYRHIPQAEVENLKQRIDQRRKKEKDLKQLRDRIKYLKKLI